MICFFNVLHGAQTALPGNVVCYGAALSSCERQNAWAQAGMARNRGEKHPKASVSGGAPALRPVRKRWGLMF